MKTLKIFVEKTLSFFSRYISEGKCFASLSYSRIGNNLSECVFQLKDLRFFRVDSFFSKSGEFFAVGKAAKYVQEYKPAEVTKTFGFFLSLLVLMISR